MHGLVLAILLPFSWIYISCTEHLRLDYKHVPKYVECVRWMCLIIFRFGKNFHHPYEGRNYLCTWMYSLDPQRCLSLLYFDNIIYLVFSLSHLSPLHIKMTDTENPTQKFKYTRCHNLWTHLFWSQNSTIRVYFIDLVIFPKRTSYGHHLLLVQQSHFPFRSPIPLHVNVVQ